MCEFGSVLIFTSGLVLSHPFTVECYFISFHCVNFVFMPSMDSLADSVFDTLAVAKDLRSKILRVMGDKLVNSLSVSTVEDVHKVCIV